ncbi:hypothetical protein BJX61DRAFT_539756 [Aspergillus egyptiacus]|nr:hypothetical protein BJX61DRAFT_539756 [Aspergillus egyptiacus]
MTHPDLNTLPAEILLRIYQCCDAFSQAISLASANRRCLSVWETQKPTILWHIVMASIVGFDDALMAEPFLLQQQHHNPGTRTEKDNLNYPRPATFLAAYKQELNEDVTEQSFRTISRPSIGTTRPLVRWPSSSSSRADIPCSKMMTIMNHHGHVSGAVPALFHETTRMIAASELLQAHLIHVDSDSDPALLPKHSNKFRRTVTIIPFGLFFGVKKIFGECFFVETGHEKLFSKIRSKFIVEVLEELIPAVILVVSTDGRCQRAEEATTAIIDSTFSLCGVDRHVGWKG